LVNDVERRCAVDAAATAWHGRASDVDLEPLGSVEVEGRRGRI